MKIAHRAIWTVGVATAGFSGISWAADCRSPAPTHCAPPPNSAGCRCQSVETAPGLESATAQPTAAPAMFAAPAPSGEISGERRGLTFPALELTLPAITVQTPQLRFLGSSRQRRDAHMQLDSARAPMATGAPALYSPLTGAGLPLMQAAGAPAPVAAPARNPTPESTATPEPPAPTAAPAPFENCAPPPVPPACSLREELERARRELKEARRQLAEVQQSYLPGNDLPSETVQSAAIQESPPRGAKRLSSVGQSLVHSTATELQDIGRTRLELLDSESATQVRYQIESPVEPAELEAPLVSQAIETTVVRAPQSAVTGRTSLFRRLVGKKPVQLP